MGQHLVDHQLHEDGYRQGQHMQHQGADRYVAHEAALLEDFRHEPAEIEGLLLVQQRVGAFEQDQLTGPGSLEIRLRQKEERARRLGQGIHHRHLGAGIGIPDAHHNDGIPVWVRNEPQNPFSWFRPGEGTMNEHE